MSDALLRAVSDRIAGSLQPADLLARLDGDAFVALVAGDNARARSEDVARALIARVGDPYVLAEHRLVAALSFGIADPWPRRDGHAHLKAAETALHRAKATGGNTSVVFDRAMLAGQAERLALEVDLWEAFEKQQFEVYYQPQVDLRDGEDDRRGGAAALEQSAARRGVFGRFRAGGRGGRPDRADRRMGADARVRGRRALARRASPGGQRLADAVHPW